MNIRVKKFIKQFKCVRKLHASIVNDYAKQRALNYNIDEITPLIGEKDEGFVNYRINIAIPTLKKAHVFGGITTALDFFFTLSKSASERILLTDSDVHKEDIAPYEGFEIVDFGKISNYKKQVVACNDRQFTKCIVSRNDIFIATSWWSAYILVPIVKWQNDVYGTNHKLIYLIQDYEPGFYPWSSRCLLADSTYNADVKTIAVFNTELLRDFLTNKGKSFYKQYVFEPVLNKDLRKYAFDNKVEKKKKMIVYGRPSVDRNCFEILVGSIKRLLEIYTEANEWEFISLGEMHESVQLNDQKQLVSLGKVTLDEYAKVMQEAYVGLSLMVSPHPSYPPLEMASFSVKTITNTYANKNLADFSNHIISLENCSYENIAMEIKTIMCEYPLREKLYIKPSYMDQNTQLFDSICNEILKEVINE